MTVQDTIVEQLKNLERGVAWPVLHKAVSHLITEHIISDEFFATALLSLQQQNIVAVDYPPAGPPLVRLGSIVADAPPWPIKSEQDLEPHIEGYIWRNFDRLFRHSGSSSYSLLVHNTARGGVADGVWKRPDLTAAIVSRFEYAPVPSLDLIGFELKLHSGCRVPSVHEALSHTAHVHFAYLVIYLPDDPATLAQSLRALPQVLSQAQLHGIGVLTTSDPRKDSTYQMLLEAQRKQPSLQRIDEFIQNRFHPTCKLALKAWLGTQRGN